MIAVIGNVVCNILLAACGVVLVGCGVMLVSLMCMQWVLPLQKLYVMTLGKDPGDEITDWQAYRDIRKLIKSGEWKLPIVGLFDFTEMEVRREDEYTRFMKDNPFHAKMFPLGNGKWELCIYNNKDKIVLSSFYQLMCRDLAYKSGYTKKDLDQMLIDVVLREKERRAKEAELLKAIDEELKSRKS